MTEKKNFFWDIFKEDWQREEFYENLVEYNEYVDLLSFKSYISDITKYPYKTQEKNLEFLRKQTLSFLYPLLKNGELVMLLIGFEEKKREDGVCCQKESYISTKENAEKIIKRLEELWLAEDECNGKGIESLTLFTLPENKDILLYWNPTKEIKLKEDWEKIKKGK